MRALLRHVLCVSALSPLAALVAGPAGLRLRAAPLQAHVPAAPQMVLTDAPLPPALLEASMVLAGKSEADELLDEFFINFPTIFTGFVVAFFVIQYVKEVVTPLQESFAKACVATRARQFVF